METQAKQTTHFYSKAALAERYGVAVRTIDRWKDGGFFPEPDLILPSGSPRWSDDTVAAHERNSVRRKGDA
jgi:hypothetical protein